MNTNRQRFINNLQTDARKFITKNNLELNGVIIEPKEIEIYYYKEGVFEDNSVHKNELQTANPNHFYIHRIGTKRTDTYKGGNYPGIDYVISNEPGTYHSYLIRSAVLDDQLVIGPNKVLRAILQHTNMTKEELEATNIRKITCDRTCDVLYSNRINLGKTVSEDFVLCQLRIVLCDNLYRQSSYPQKEEMIVEHLRHCVLNQQKSKEEALYYAKEKLGYVPSIIRAL